MPSARDIFIHCDELDALPPANKANYLFELEWLERTLPGRSRTLQVGSMDGMRAVRLLEVRPDIQLTGLEIEPELVALAGRNVTLAGVDARFVTGDITDPPDTLEPFDRVLCLNNTLGYIPDVPAALQHMQRLAPTAVVSVYGELFSDELAREYFTAVGLDVTDIEDDIITLADFSAVRRFAKATVRAWGGSIVDTPIGYLTVLGSP